MEGGARCGGWTIKGPGNRREVEQVSRRVTERLLDELSTGF